MADAFEISWPNLGETIARLEPSGFLSPAAHTFLVDASKALTIAAQAESPVRTGFLRSSHVELTGDGSGFSGKWGVKVTAPYAIFVHNGTRHMRGRPWLAGVMAKAPQILGPALEKFINKLESRWKGSL